MVRDYEWREGRYGKPAIKALTCLKLFPAGTFQDSKYDSQQKGLLQYNCPRDSDERPLT